MTKLGLDDATIALMAAIDAAPADEQVESYMLGEYAPDIGGGFYWQLTTRRMYSNETISIIGEATNRARMKRQVLAKNVELANAQHAEAKA